jgi:hypothetical protein
VQGYGQPAALNGVDQILIAIWMTLAAARTLRSLTLSSSAAWAWVTEPTGKFAASFFCCIRVAWLSAYTEVRQLRRHGRTLRSETFSISATWA